MTDHKNDPPTPLLQPCDVCGFRVPRGRGHVQWCTVPRIEPPIDLPNGKILIEDDT